MLADPDFCLQPLLFCVCPWLAPVTTWLWADSQDTTAICVLGSSPDCCVRPVLLRTPAVWPCGAAGIDSSHWTSAKCMGVQLVPANGQVHTATLDSIAAHTPTVGLSPCHWLRPLPMCVCTCSQNLATTQAPAASSTAMSIPSALATTTTTLVPCFWGLQ